ncbi:ubiquitin carboxyl-terminal hydrolase Usp2 [Musca vetustissima]|uniref:ubiquitin carboxyl-terminal hydrolase Usp2 n=1 Tax=Musca vetustissima TaxID=27455 RepID=UPI002AB5EF7E|nr:ubiquitin carboxyl-terminal hydrolase Usp2 [Musca vetustissima]
MPVISPRRSSTSASGSIYTTSSSSAAVGPTTSSESSSSSSRSVSDRYSSSAYKSYLDRAGSLSKLTSSTSSYSPNISSYSSYSSYTPRSSTTYRSSASSLTGGSSGVGTYRSILPSLGSNSSSYDTTTLSRYGVRKHGKALDILKNDCNGRESTVSKKPPSGSDCSGAGSGSRESKRLSGSSSSSSLARLVATSGLDMYEKYSPAHYKPNTELSGSRSGLNEAGISNDIEERGRTTDISNNTSTTANDLRSRNRYSRLYSRQDTDETDNVSSAIRSSSATALNSSASVEDVPTITLSRTRLRRSKPTEDKETKKSSLRNGTSDYDSKTSSSLDRPLITSNGIDTVVHIKLNKLKVNDHNANTENSISTTTAQEEKNDPVTTTSNHHNSIETPEDNDASNKTTSNFQKFPMLKEKCDPEIVTTKDAHQQQQQQFKNSTVTKYIPAVEYKHSGKEIQVKGSLINVQSSEAESNPVRKANQPFFLINAYKDQNFLKEECELAHALVAKVAKDSGKNSTKTLPQVKDFRPLAISNNIFYSNNNLQRPSAAFAATTNGMRRTGNGTHLGTTTAVATATNKVEINYSGPQFKGLSSSSSSSSTTVSTFATSASTASKKLNSAASNSSSSTSFATNKLNIRNQVKPLVHRSSVLATNSFSSSIHSLQQKNNHNNNNNNNNNNGSNNSLNNIAATSSGNNNMQTSLDQDDIKFIDSDEPPPPAAMASERKSTQSGYDQRCCINASTSSSSKNRIRPKSTIICSSSHSASSTSSSSTSNATNNMIFEKINHYKYANGSLGAGLNSTLSSSVDRRTETAIDQNSIRASIEKFNSFSEQKRLPPSSVTLRSHSGSGSTSNLQHHRHSSDLDNCNLKFPNNGGGSLTRTPYRSSGTSGAGKVITSLHPSASAAVSSASSRHAAILSSSPNNTGSLPLKSSKHYAQAEDTTFTSLSSSVDGDASKKKLASISGGLTETMDETSSVRTYSALKSTLPTASPTSSRYWDRDTSRSSLISSSTSQADDNKKSAVNDEETEGLCGLRNIGNTCFMNSVIQCLSHTNELTKFLRNYNATKSPTSKDQQILYEFSKLIKEMWTNNVHSVTPMELKRSFSAKHRMYSDYNQQDAQEFLRFFLDSLHCALNTGVKGEVLKIDDNLSDNKKAELTWEWYSRLENSLIRDLFVGQLKSTLRCTTCGNTSVTFDPFWDLSVPLPSSSRCKLEACLDLFIREEVLDGDEMPTCSKCQTRRKCTKSFTIQRFPKYLVIHLKRFSETRWSKLSNIVEFPTGERELNMGPYGANANSNMYFSLYAISNHMGSTAGGHYVAICKHPVSKKWHEFNDNLVSESLSEHHLVSSSAYILFYERA